ncbi:MAG: alpha/beta fold hydrolase [Candidatus Binatia bacterium]
MPFVELRRGRMWYEEAGSGPVIACLHGGWGRAVMPFDDAIPVLGPRWRLVFPDRFGYGRSDPIERLPLDYHARSAEDLRELLDALGIGRAVLWGHSDGAVNAALFAAAEPGRVAALVLEAAHLHRAKSREFFASHAADPEILPERVRERLAADHGSRWTSVVRMHSRVWLDFHAVGGDFYEGRLETIACPTLVLHGAGDPHTPVEEIAELARRIPGAELEIAAEGGHSPHSEPATARFCSERVARFLGEIAGDVVGPRFR